MRDWNLSQERTSGIATDTQIKTDNDYAGLRVFGRRWTPIHADRFRCGTSLSESAYALDELLFRTPQLIA
jgi:hypothetical protein